MEKVLRRTENVPVNGGNRRLFDREITILRSTEDVGISRRQDGEGAYEQHMHANQGHMFASSLANDTDERLQPNNAVSIKEIDIHQEFSTWGRVC